ncbi:Jerky-like protein [Temnothorax longispinosus]|uniref:Jerky-like protein n=1 Tax=Temnothorax longispinosus TaxID=300112 RepID=A0A4S2KK62_9HYME|nr:Jerky-like protein [Temnothorax longispinosus]
MTLVISAQGNSIPPFFIFPRVNFKPHFLNSAPAGSAGATNASGWMIAENFLLFLEHFVLLILDNHDSHISIAALEFCQKNWITVLSLPPHCSHKLQPLDRSIFGPLKKAVNQHCDYWMTSNLGKTMSIYDIPAIINRALSLAVTSTNIMAGFATTGILPFNPDVFGEIDFLPSQVTDRVWYGDNASQPSTSSGQMPETRQELPQTSNPTNPTENIDVSSYSRKRKR